MQNYDIAIIGGGAAGLFSAAFASDMGANVVVLEKMERCGRKIGITGKGRCNLTNTKPWNEFSQHIHTKSNFLKTAFYTTDNFAVMKYFESIGLQLVVERGDRVFPKSMCAHDVSDFLIRHIKDNGAGIITSFNVSSIKSIDNMFVISSCNNIDNIYAKKVIIATGGLSYPSTGSTGDGYLFAKEFGHHVISCFPSLTALIPDKYNLFFDAISSFFREEKSLLLKNVEVSLIINGNNVATEFGDLDFTSGGIEGPIGFKVSRTAVFALINGQKVELLLDFKTCSFFAAVAFENNARSASVF
jgi:flavoprotein, HI0933 family